MGREEGRAKEKEEHSLQLALDRAGGNVEAKGD